MKKYFLTLILPLVLVASLAAWWCSANCGTSKDDIEWAPAEFKNARPMEWDVVNKCINIQQKEVATDFTAIDKLVQGYVNLMEIALPTDASMRIKCIEEVCETKFDISGYDDSNWGMHIAAGTCNLFKRYINWLYENEAMKVLAVNKIVDTEREEKLFGALNDAMAVVCDSLAFCMEGSGGWCGWIQIDDIDIDFNKCMYQAIMGVETEKMPEMDVPLELFDAECDLWNKNYASCYEDRPIDVSEKIDRFKNAYHAWYEYRKDVANSLKDSDFKKIYESITYSFARLHFVHLKNRFNDIGMGWDEECLSDDCTDQELLEYKDNTPA